MIEIHCGETWTTHDTPMVIWETPVDQGSGVAGYRILIDTIEEEISGDSHLYHPKLETGSHSIRLRAIDELGQMSGWSNTITVKIDTISPYPPVITSSTHPKGVPTDHNRPEFALTQIPDDSGIVGYYYSFNQDPLYVPNEYDMWLSNTDLGEVTISIPGFASMTGHILPVADGKWYLHVRSKDKVNLLGLAVGRYTVIIATSASKSRFDLSGDRQGDITVIGENGEVGSSELVTGAELVPLFNPAPVLDIAKGDAVDMARLATGWPSAIVHWKAIDQKAIYYQSTGSELSDGIELFGADALPFGMDVSSGDRMLFADLNDNGRDDLILFDQDAQQFYKSMINDYNISALETWILPPLPVSLPKGDSIEFVQLDDDGIADLVVLKPKDSQLYIQPGKGGNPTVISGYSLDTAMGDTLRIGDISGDGKDDLVWVAASVPFAPHMVVQLNNTSDGEVSFSDPVQWGRLMSPIDSVKGERVMVYPADGDEKADLVIFRHAGTVDLYSSTGFSFDEGLSIGENGNFAIMQPSQFVNSGLFAPPYMVTSDTDGDGVPDYSDNCHTLFNSNQLDDDEDGIGDACESTVFCPMGCYQHGGLPGDVNGDGLVNVVDVQCMILVSLAEMAGDPYPLCLVYPPDIVDWICDGEVNIVDVQTSTNIALKCDVDTGCEAAYILEMDGDQDNIRDSCDTCLGMSTPINACHVNGIPWYY